MKYLILLMTLLYLLPAEGHESAGVEDLVRHYAKIAELSGQIVERPYSVPFARIQGKNFEFDGPMWELVQGWIRIYYKEIQFECESCIPMSEEEFLARTRDEAAKSFLQVKLSDPALEGLEHISVGTASLGSQLGTTAAVAKITAEIGETVVSKFVGGGGVHVVCSILDAVILFGTRHVQTAAHAWSWSPRFGRSGAANLLRMGFVNSVIKKAQRKIRFEVGPIDFNKEELAELDAEGPNRWWGWVAEGKRAQWLKKLNKNQRPLSLAKKEFLGGRMKRYLWLKGRKRGHATFMRGSSAVDEALNKDVLWILQVQESLIQRAFTGEPQQRDPSLALRVTPVNDPIREGLAAEFGGADERLVMLFENLQREVEVVFTPHLSRKVRYFQVAKLEALLQGFIHARFSEALALKGEMHGHSLPGIWRQVKLHWRAGKFGAYIFDWTDFLRLAAIETDPERLALHRYESMESLLRILKVVQSSGQITEVRDQSDLNKFESMMANDNQLLNTFTPWREKRTSFSWLPFVNPKPRCEDLSEVKP